MARFPNFAGSSYQSLSKAAAFARTINYQVEGMEVPGTGKTDVALYPRPGSKPFCPTVADGTYIHGPVRAMCQFDTQYGPDPVRLLNGSVWGISGASFWRMQLGGGAVGNNNATEASFGYQDVFGTVADDGLPAQIFTNGAAVDQIFIVSAGHGYCLSDGVFAEIPIDGINFFGAVGLAFMDGYFIVLSNIANHAQFQLSNLGDGTTWNGANVALLLGQADQIVALIVNLEYIYFFGSRRGEIWYNTGNALFPMAIESGAFLEVGTNAAASVCKLASDIFWIGQDASGSIVAMHALGLAAERISTHAVEAAWANKDPLRGIVYPTTDDCICYTLRWNGHSLVRYIFPSADAGWEYDITESARLGYRVWNEINFTDQLGVPHAPFERAHCYAFGVHLIGSGGADGSPGAIYQLDESTYYDAVGAPASPGSLGFPLIRDHIVRLPFAGGLRQFLDRLEFFIQSGVGLAAGQGANPKLLLRISRDGGNTWGREIEIPMGLGGHYATRLVVNRLGSYRDGAIWLRVSDPVFAALVGAETYMRAGGS